MSLGIYAAIVRILPIKTEINKKNCVRSLSSYKLTFDLASI